MRRELYDLNKDLASIASRVAEVHDLLKKPMAMHMEDLSPKSKRFLLRKEMMENQQLLEMDRSRIADLDFAERTPSGELSPFLLREKIDLRREKEECEVRYSVLSARPSLRVKDTDSPRKRSLIQERVTLDRERMRLENRRLELKAANVSGYSEGLQRRLATPTRATSEQPRETSERSRGMDTEAAPSPPDTAKAGTPPVGKDTLHAGGRIAEDAFPAIERRAVPSQ